MRIQFVDYRLEVLGRFRLNGQEGQTLTTRPSYRRLLAILAILGPLHRSEVAEALWPGLAEGQAQSNLRTVLWRMRQQHGELASDCDGYLSLTGEVGVDLKDVVEWCHSVLAGDRHGAPPPAIAKDVLPGWADIWLGMPREELQVLRLHALEAAGERLLVAGQYGEASHVVRTAVHLDPLRDSANKLLIGIYLQEGNTVEAVRHYRLFATRLRDDVGVEPNTGTTALISRYVFDGQSRVRRD